MVGQISRKQIPIRAVRISMNEIRRVYQRLQDQVREECENRIRALEKIDDQIDAEFEAEKEEIRAEAFKITVRIVGRSGEELIGSDESIFDSPNLPDDIISVFMTNVTAFENFTKTRPQNSFNLLLDFSKPPLMDNRNPVSNPTPNNSNLEISGDRDSWVASIETAVTGVINNRRTKRGWLHQAFIYDVGVLFFGIPASIYVCWQLSGFVELYLTTIHSFVAAAAYVYVVFFVLTIYRVFFGYTKWAFPVVELTNSSDAAKKHRAFWFALLIALIAQFTWGVVNW